MDRNKIKKRLIFWYFFVWLFFIIALYQGYVVYFVDITSTKSKWVGLFAGAVSILLASVKILENISYYYKDSYVQKIVDYFHRGALIFLKQQFKIFLILLIFMSYFIVKKMSIPYLISFISGALTFFVSYYASLFICSRTEIRIVKAIDESSNYASRLALNSGVVSTMMSVGICLSVIVILFHLFKDYQIINGFLLGACVPCIFSTVSSAIIKKSSSCASGIVSNYIADIDLADKRSPLILLEGVSRMIFDVNSVVSDMLLIFCSVLIASMTIGAFAYNLMGCFLPIIICASGVFASIFVILLLKISKSKSQIRVIYSSVVKSVILLCALSFYCIKLWIPNSISLLYSVMLGSFFSILICFINVNYISSNLKPVRNVANIAISGFLLTFLQSVREGFMSVFAPILLIALNIILSFIIVGGIESPLFGIYGIALSVLSMISVMGVILCANIYSVVLSSSNQVLKYYENNDFEIKDTKQANYLGEAAINIATFGKNFFNAASILSSILLLIAYTFVAELEIIDILNPYVLGSLFIGASLPFLYIAFVLSGLNKTSKRLVAEAKRQFRNFPQILRFEMKPDYEQCVVIASKNSTIQAIFYAFVIFIIFLLIAFYLKSEAVGGLILGVILVSSCLLFFASNSSVVVRNAKKYLRKEYENSNLSDEYVILVQNDEVFDSIRELFIPVLKNLMNFLAILAITLAPLFM